MADTSGKSNAPRLEEYRAKRSAARTPEPFGGPGTSRPYLFVVQQHHARRAHFDLRLELGGVLKSWAVPRGPSLDPSEKRLAVQTEDHPVEYADFEGIIPAGNYGAGPVIVWDHGAWHPVGDPEEGLRRGRLHFTLKGYKLRGAWTLVRTKGKPQEWLLIKQQDPWAAPGAEVVPGSVLSGLQIDELALGEHAREGLREEVAHLGAPRRLVRAPDVELMLAETAERPFSAKGWLFELKYDGFRALAGKEGPEANLFYRRGMVASAIYPELTRAIAALPYRSLVLDGEIVVLDDQGRPSFQRLQRRAMLSDARDIDRATVELPATFYAFDLLGFEDFDLRPLALVVRKSILRKLLPATGPLRYADHVDERGEELFEQVRRVGELEGVMAKRVDAPYRAGRSGDWLKLRLEHTADLVVVGYTAGRGSRAGFGALELAFCDRERLIYAGRVGTGFSARQLHELRALLEPSRRPTPPCVGDVPRGRGQTWVEPRLVVEVRFLGWTDEGILRQPAFLRLRDDKAPEECSEGPRPPLEPDAPAPAAPAGGEARKVPFSNLEKVFWPREGYTKGDMLEYYRSISRWLLPYLEDRPLVLTRYPDGIEGKSFFQKDAPGFAPSWIRTERIWSEDAGREIAYFVCDDEDMLLYVANLGTIPLHIWFSRVRSLEHPDWCALDLDPKGAPFQNVVVLAQAIRGLCEEIGLPCFPKTSGQAGLHVMIPLGGRCTYAQSRGLGELIARVIESERPDIATTARAIPARQGRVYLDFLQNGQGKTLVAPFSVRSWPGAPVSTPLRWSEVVTTLDPAAFSLRTVPERMRRLGEDPFAPVLALRPDLGAALERLGRRLRR